MSKGPKYGVAYLFTNDFLEKEGTYKYGITINPYQRKRTQSNSTPPSHPFYDVVVMFSPQYKEIEKELKKRFLEKGFFEKLDLNPIPNPKKKKNQKHCGREWIKGDIADIVEIYKDMLKKFDETTMCYQGKGYRYKKEKQCIEEGMLPKCRLDLLGMEGKKITCTKRNKNNKNETFKVEENKIKVADKSMTLADYMKTYHPRDSKTNEYDGYQYFKYKGVVIYDLWQSLVRGRETKNDSFDKGNI